MSLMIATSNYVMTPSLRPSLKSVRFLFSCILYHIIYVHRSIGSHHLLSRYWSLRFIEGCIKCHHFHLMLSLLLFHFMGSISLHFEQCFGLSVRCVKFRFAKVFSDWFSLLRSFSLPVPPQKKKKKASAKKGKMIARLTVIPWDAFSGLPIPGAFNVSVVVFAVVLRAPAIRVARSSEVTAQKLVFFVVEGLMMNVLFRASSFC